MRRTTIAVAVCAAVLGLSAPSASAADIVNAATNVCTGTSEWRVNLVGAYADLTVTTSTCKIADVLVEGNGNPHVNVTDGGYTGGFRTSLIGLNVIGTNSFVGIAHGFVGAGPVAAVGADSLTATLPGVNPNTATPSTSTEVHRPNGSCGANCWRTNVTWSSTWDRTP